jgi:hypothetical protein
LPQEILEGWDLVMREFMKRFEDVRPAQASPLTAEAYTFKMKPNKSLATMFRRAQRLMNLIREPEKTALMSNVVNSSEGLAVRPPSK